MGKLYACLIAMLLAATPVVALADAAGSALGVNPAASAALEGETRTLVVGADVFIGDLVETGPKGQVQILFADNTELVVGPSSTLLLEDYLIRNDGSAGKLAVDMLGGVFRFATGDSAKNRYTIDTPTGTIGVRGTEFDVWVDRARNGATYIIRHGGTIEFCTKSGDCKLLTATCEVGKIETTETAVVGDARLSQGDIRKLYKSLFPYTENQSPLLRRFWFPVARDCLNSTFEQPVYPEFPKDSSPVPPPPKNDDDGGDDGSENEPPPCRTACLRM